MLKYILRRILIFIPTLFIITIIGFAISVNAPGDPVERMVSASTSGGEQSSQNQNLAEQKLFWKRKLGLDLPVFYVSLSSIATPDTLYKVYDKSENEGLSRLITNYGNWESISNYYLTANKTHALALETRIDTSNKNLEEKNLLLENINQIRFELLSLKASYDEAVITTKIKKIAVLCGSYPVFNELKKQTGDIGAAFENIKATKSSWKNYVPAFHFYGNNQYHRWLFGDGDAFTGNNSQYTKGLIRGDFGISYITKQPVMDDIKSKIGWSLFFSLFSIIISYIISIPLGVKAASNRGSKFDKISSVILFMLYSLPSFWVAVLLLMTFANTDYPMLKFFQPSGVKPPAGYSEGAGFFTMAWESLPYLILPLVCYCYSSFAFLSRTMRVSMIEVVSMDYVRTAYAKGLSDRTVRWKHAFANSLIPIITVFANIFPAAIGGSVILETIFTIPGMGQESFNAIANQNYPMQIAILTIAGILTLIGYLISDILYAAVDPRITYK